MAWTPDGDFDIMSVHPYVRGSMYAIIETGGKQLWVVPGETVKVEKLEAEAGAKLTFKALWPLETLLKARSRCPRGRRR